MNTRLNTLVKSALCTLAALGFYGMTPDATANGLATLTVPPTPASWTDDLSSIGDSDWNYERAAHLMERAGFGGTPEQIEALAGMSPLEAVNYLVEYQVIENNELPPFVESGIWDEEMLDDIDENFDFQGGSAQARRTGSVYGATPRESGVRPFQPVIDALYYRNYATRKEWDRVAEWWANRMLNTERPLEEKMTLFWHGHFSTEQEKVRDYRLLIDQIAMLREGATGNFRDLLISVSQDPAMLVYLDNRKNVKGHANENFAREIMELFALGVGNYTEDDIKEAARAFTGWRNYGVHFINDVAQHDRGVKTVLGKTGKFTGEDVIDILLDQEVCAQFISAKLYRYFVREDVSAEVNEELAALLRDNDYEVKAVLKTIFLSKDFYSQPSYASQIKGPVDYLISTYRKLELTKVPGTPSFTYVTSALGQALGNPPNVAGWDGGRSWINPSTLIERGNVMRHVLFPAEAAGQYDLGPFAGRYQRYVNAHMDVLERDRQALISDVGPPAEMEMMEGGGQMMTALSAQMINEAPTYDLPFGVFNGMSNAFRRVLPPDQSPATMSLAAMLREAEVKTVQEAVSYLEKRFLRVPLSPSVKASMNTTMMRLLGSGTISYNASHTESSLRELLHMIMSTPEYQLG